MNESNNKKILFNKSTLLSLKAELLKKQDEVKDKKRLPQHKLENFKPPPAQKKEKSNYIIEKKSFKESLKAVDTDELEELKKSKAALEKKAELYDHLSDSIGTSHLSNQFLVDFNNKRQEELRAEQKSLEDTYCIDDSEWTEYIDCLGRSRKCLKSDLELYKKRDLKLSKTIIKGTNELNQSTSTQVDQLSNPEPQAETLSVETELMRTTTDYLQSLRDKWEQKENELLAKKGDIHYQDVLFDEARVHGVGYYAFSTDEAVRKKQMEDLVKTREETIQAQKEAEAMRKKRNDLIAARAAAARARQRLRAGLPPEDPEENKINFEKILMEFLTQQRDAVENEENELERKEKEEREREREKLRKEYVREWDLGKEGLETKGKFREMSQEEYVEQQRAKRIKEFAPKKDEKHKSESSFNSKGELVSEKPKTWANVRPVVNNVTDYVIPDNETKGLYFSSKANKYSNFVQGATLIVNELDKEEPRKERPLKRKSEHVTVPPPNISDNNDTSTNDNNWDIPLSSELKRQTSHAEIPPPPTFEYNCPSTNTQKSKKPFYSDMLEAYSQGLKQLEKKESKSKICEKYTFI